MISSVLSRDARVGLTETQALSHASRAHYYKCDPSIRAQTSAAPEVGFYYVDLGPASSAGVVL